MAVSKALDHLEPLDGTKQDDQNLIVALRIRPMNEDEIIQGAIPIAHRVDKNMIVLMDPIDDQADILRANRSREKQYMFDYAFDGSTVQEDVYENTSKFLISNVIKGYNATVFAYGATGTGKTYTMLGSQDEHGIMARALGDLFIEVENTRNDMNYEITMSYLEIYNEMIRDLLNPSSGFLDLREDNKGVQVTGLTTLSTESLQQFSEILRRGNKERTQEPTAANKTSSRSHAVLQLTVRQRSNVHGVHHEVRVGKLFLIDLAGSERAANTHNKGKRMVEGAHINRSLLALGNCINALSDKSGSRYVNYRDSKLTRLLKDALGGNCRTVMIAHISPASIHFEESRNTLVYADRAKRIKTKVRRNVLDVSYHVSQYVNLINELVQENKKLRHRLEDTSQQNPNSSALQAIQSEILHSGSRHGNASLASIKDELLNVFKEQMECRHSLMNLNNNSMQISMEKTRNQLLVQKWEREKPIRRKTELLGNEKWNKSTDDLSTDLVSVEDNSSEPAEVSLARDELVALDQEQEQTEALKQDLLKDLDATKEKAARVQELLPTYCTSTDQQEIVSLLIKVHELEIEKLEVQTSCLRKNYEIQRRDMYLAVQNDHRSLCEKIIDQQKALIDEHLDTYPKELEELYTLYLQEVKSSSTFLPPIPAFKTPSMTSLEMHRMGVGEGESTTGTGTGTDKASNPDSKHHQHQHVFSVPPPIHTHHLTTAGGAAGGSRPQLYRQTSHTEKKEKIFSHSPKAEQLRQSIQLSGSVPENRFSQPHTRQKSVVTLSSHSTTPPPSHKELPPPPAPLPTTQSLIAKPQPSAANKMLIQTNTRSIAALAEKKRKSRHLDANNNTRLPLAGGGVSEGDSYLTASRLAHHNQRYPLGNDVTLRQLLGDDALSHKSRDPVLHQPEILKHGQGKHKRTTKKATVTGGAGASDVSSIPTHRTRHPHTHDTNPYQLSPEEFFKQLGRTGGPRRLGGVLDQSSYGSLADNRQLYRNRSHVSHRQPHPHADHVFDEDMRHLEMAPTPASTTVHQAAPQKGRGLTVQKKLRGKGSSDTSQSGTPQPSSYHKSHLAAAAPPRRHPSNQPTATGTTSGIPVTTATTRPNKDFNVTGFSLQK